MFDLLKEFHTVAKIRTGFFDENGQERLAYPLELSPFCTMVRANEKGFRACMACDQQAFNHVRKGSELHTYRCHMGLVEAIVPVKGDGKEPMCFLVMGQLRPQNEDVADVARHLAMCIKKLDMSASLEALMEAYANLATMSAPEIAASGRLLQVCASYVWMDDLIRQQREPLAKRAEAYIRQHYAENLSVSVLTRELGVGKTALWTAVKETYGHGLTELIRQIRIQKAQQLLQASKRPVKEIAEMVGIDDYNYFTKCFKTEMGTTPTTFRKLCDNEYRILNAQQNAAS